MLLSLLVVFGAAPAFAALGGDASSVEADRVRAQGALLRIQRVDSHTVHEIQTATGTAIREYVSPSGTVFGVAWSGPVVPDLRQLLGAYFDVYRRAAARTRQSRRGRGPLAIDDGGLVVQASGHMRSFTGRAYVNRLVPSGVQPDAIR